MPANTQWLDAVMSKYVAGQLARFRAEVESRTYQPIGTVQIDAARLLSDLCRHFLLGRYEFDTADPSAQTDISALPLRSLEEIIEQLGLGI